MPSTYEDTIDGVSTSVAIKAPCLYTTTANISLSGLAVQGGGEWASVLTAEDRIFVQDQTNPVDNGIWLAGTGTWARAKDFDGARDVVQGTLIPVYRGVGTYAIYTVTNANPIVIGTTSLAFAPASDFALSANIGNTSDTSLGDALVGVKKTGGDATTQHVLNETRIYDVVADFGAVLDGSDETAKFQAAIDALPSDGGFINVGDGTTPTLGALTIPLHKMVTWLDNGAILPSTMPGNVVKSGASAQPHEGGLGASTRPGDKFVFLQARHNPDPAQVNQQDSILYIEGFEPDVSMPLDNEFAGVRVNMSSEASNSTAALRCFHGTATGVGGSAKLRAMRLISIGMDGHDGLVIGGLFSAVRTGIIPASAGGNGVDEYASGDAGPYVNSDYAIYGAVGPGIRGVLLLGGQEGAEKPQTGIQQARGAQALLPEIAFIDMHGGGAGDLVRVLQDETSSTEIATWENTGKLAVPAYRSNIGSQSIADDAVLSITPPSGSGVFKWWLENSTTSFGEIYYRTTAGGGEANTAASTLGSNVTIAAAGTALAGTTGADGNVTVCVDGNVILVENRLGAARNIGYVFFGS